MLFKEDLSENTLHLNILKNVKEWLYIVENNEEDNVSEKVLIM